MALAAIVALFLAKPGAAQAQPRQKVPYRPTGDNSRVRIELLEELDRVIITDLDHGPVVDSSVAAFAETDEGRGVDVAPASHASNIGEPAPQRLVRRNREANAGRAVAEDIESDDDEPLEEEGHDSDDQLGGDQIEVFGEFAGCSSCQGSNCHAHCGRRRSRLWVQADYLMWWNKGTPLPPLVTTALPDTPRDDAGALDTAGTEILFGGDRVNNDLRSGGRLTLGYWLDECQTVGLGGGFFALGDGQAGFSAGSPGDPILARPFRDVTTDTEESQLVAYRSTADGDVLAGNVSARTTNDILNADAYLRTLLVDDGCRRVDLVTGYRFSRIDEDLQIEDSLTVLDQGGVVPIGTTLEGLDLFDVKNEFHGGTLGLMAERHSGRWSLQMASLVSLGNMRQTVRIDGRTVTTVPTLDPVVREGSLQAQPTNIGTYRRDRFSVVPEFRLNLSYHINDCWRANVGYTFVYWSDVMRVGHAVDYGVNPTQITGPLVGDARPEFRFRDGDLWAQGLNFGLEHRF